METLLEKVVGLDFTVTGNGDRWRKTEQHSSLVLDIKEQKWFWNSRALQGSPLDYLITIKGIPEKQAKEIIKDLVYVGQGELSFPGKKEQVVQNEKLVEVFWNNGLNDRDYWYRRCLTDKTIDTYKLGKYDGFWTLPIYMDGKFLNFQCRTDVPEKKIRPWYRGVGPLLFNSSILSFVKTVFITEGPVDAILLNQLGFPAVSHTGGSSGWSDAWFPYFKEQKEILYVADNDLAGYNAVKKVAKSLGEYRVKIVSFLDYPLGYDAVKFFLSGGTVEKFKELVSLAEMSFKAKELCEYIEKKFPSG
jgi:DNA primase